MAMRPDVRRHAIILIVFGISQWIIVTLGLQGNWWNLDKNARIVTFCFSAFAGAWCVMGALLYMALKGNKDKS